MIFLIRYIRQVFFNAGLLFVFLLVILRTSKKNNNLSLLNSCAQDDAESRKHSTHQILGGFAYAMPSLPRISKTMKGDVIEQKHHRSEGSLHAKVTGKTRGTKTTGTGSRRVEKSIFHRLKQEANDVSPADPTIGLSCEGNERLYVQRREHDILFHIETLDKKGNDNEADKSRGKISTVSLSYDHQHTASSSSPCIQARFESIETVNNSIKERIPIDGIYGVYCLPSGPHIVLIYQTENVYSSPVQTSDKHAKENRVPLFELKRVSKMEILPLPGKGKKKLVTAMERKEEERQLRLLRESFREHAMYFTPLHRKKVQNKDSDFRIHDDFTHTLQRTYLLQDADELNVTDEVSNTTRPSSAWRKSDPRFFWNGHLVRPLLPQTNINDKDDEATNRLAVEPYNSLLRWVIPCTSAFVGIRSSIPLSAGDSTKRGPKLALNTTYDLLLISRRSKYRVGTRFTRRGADATGAVTNYAETEQIIIVGDEVYSHVQTRGSIPLHWSSPADVKTYAPRVRIGVDPLAQARALRNHLLEQLSLYGLPFSNGEKKMPQLVFCNLVDKKGDQGRLGRSFDSVLNAVLDVYGNNSIFTEKVKHIWYDFHAECKGGKWHKLKFLLDNIRPFLDYQGYFSARGSKICSLQKGSIRTNCMDCLDRTNVVQSLFARYVIYNQLYDRVAKRKRSGRTMPLEYVVAYRKQSLSLPWKDGEQSHRALWADNADVISNLYAGTNALKGDFTRTGQRTRKGMLDDGVNSVTRYYLNNFADARRQEGYDLLTGASPFSYVQDDYEHVLDVSRGEETGSLPPGEIKNSKNPNRRKGRRGLGLNLRWLPGDLKSHTISEAMAADDVFDDVNLISASSSLKAAKLASIDRRAGSDRPWWAVEDDEIVTEYENTLSTTNLSKVIHSVSDGNGMMNIIGSTVAVLKAPFITAAILVLTLWPGIFNLAQSEEKENNERSMNVTRED